MWEKGTPRGKTRRASTPDASLIPASDTSTTTATAADSSWHEAVFPQGVGGGPMPEASASELLELHRRCFSCCNAILQQQASLVRGDERLMLRQQTAFTEHPLMKSIRKRVSDQRYTDVKEFFNDFTQLVNTCIAAADRRGVLEALTNQLVATAGTESKRHSKATFQGFPHPLLEDMMANASSARKKIPPGGTVHVTIDVGRYLAKAYGLGLSAGARFCGDASQEKAFYAQRKKREIEQASLVGSKASIAALKVQKQKNKAKEKSAEGPKKKQKLQPPVETPPPVAIPKVNRSLRATRRMAADDSTDDLHHRPSVGTHDLQRPSVDTHYLQRPSVSHVSTVSFNHVPDRRVVNRRICKREKVHCHHLQGHDIEMEDPDYTGFKFTGTLQGTKIACHCGCDGTLPAISWLMHNAGRAKSKSSAYPWKYLRLVETKMNLADHFPVCDCHEHLCDTCRSWEAPGATMVSCWRCRTSIHATEECAIRVVHHEDDPMAPGSPAGTADQEAHGSAPEAQGATPNITAAANGKQGTTTSGGDNDALLKNFAARRSIGGDEPDGMSSSSSLAGGVSRSRPCRRKGAAEAKSGSASGASVASAEDEPGVGDGGSVGDPEAEANANEFAWICQICSGGGAEYVSGDGSSGVVGGGCS